MDGVWFGVALLASGAAAGGGFDWLEWIARIINFLIFAGVILYFVGPVLVRLLKGRQVEIRRELEQAEQAVAEARRRKAEIEATLARLEEEGAAIKEAARREAEEEKAGILARTARDAERLVALAEQQIDSAGREARQDLRRHVARLSTELAVEVLRKEIGPGELKHLFEEGVDSLEAEA